jgi:tetratricopeptide (TPR) repeat protein
MRWSQRSAIGMLLGGASLLAQTNPPPAEPKAPAPSQIEEPAKKRAARPQTWIELRSTHFIVVSNAKEKEARQVGYQFELIRAVFEDYFRQSESATDPPLSVIAVKDEHTFKELMPEFWAKKGSVHPAGYYLGGAEENYVVLRLDISTNEGADVPYEPFYHEYVHYLMRRLMFKLPLWMIEGLAEFYGNTRIEGKRVLVGAPSRSHILFLRDKELLRVGSLFDVNASSPYYHEDNKADIFYAESWALTHYLVVRDWEEGTHRVEDFVALLGQGVDQREAARRTIGDPASLEPALRKYIQNSTFNAARQNPPKIEENSFEMREMSEAESLTVRADFKAHDHQYFEAQAMLEESVKLDPKQPTALEVMGFLYLQQGKLTEAEKCYSEAVAHDSHSYLANYYYAQSLLKGPLDDDSAAKAETSLRIALSANPHFAPSYDLLAYLLLSRNKKVDEAYKMALQAKQLDPANIHYCLREVAALEHLGRAQDAVDVAIHILPTTHTPADHLITLEALVDAERFLAYQKFEAFRKEQTLARQSTNQGSVTPTTVRTTSMVTPTVRRPPSLGIPRPARHASAPQITPTFVNVVVGTTQRFAASLTTPAAKNVVWKVFGTGCAGATCGTISSDGLYTAPAKVPMPPAVTIAVSSVDAPNKAAFALVTILQPNH